MVSMLMIVGFVLAFIAFFIATMMTFQGSLPAPVAAIISGLTVAFLYWYINGLATTDLWLR
ncbi:hypothetical protein HEH74_001601 [Campylobacter jejuni]|uniref:hypothetical protein n=2 Tax=Campylobacteraceae TaxID=72294 RepID=UPI000F891935|nr:hypothetical protein [Campylobacter jejuni]EAH9234718.1 hypothetical protein [Campylobacter jejuni]EAI0960364.1 hypothetical protein [Campylobacter jejuni]EAI2189606.1 hypothetical protein [Campylobacter jejuni]EAI2229489.1 hypothetical protein [Campylobacter jejuni]EAI6055440.1 hypothetical protein [Campylobacter jejuni]